MTDPPEEVLEQPLWVPSAERGAKSAMSQFIGKASRMAARPLASYTEAHRWSVDECGAFWELVWEHCEVIGDRAGPAFVDAEQMINARFFPEAQLNFTENLLRGTGTADAIVFHAEGHVERRLSWDELKEQVGRLRRWLVNQGLRPGDRVAAMMPNLPETVVAMLATASLGGIWSSCSPDLGEEAVVARFGQIEPLIFLSADGYVMNGVTEELGGKIHRILERLPSVSGGLVVEHVVAAREIWASDIRLRAFHESVSKCEADVETYERFLFGHPLCVVYSSGTTGLPKCIVHSAGGTLLQHLKEHRLHCDIKKGDRVFFATTPGWMMWNWLVSTLACGATVVLYDGSPFEAGGLALFDLIDLERLTHFGVSAKFMDACRIADLTPATTHDLSSLRAILTTGSPLSPQAFTYVYRSIKNDVHLASISGGTDIISCFVMGIPTRPVWAGEIQGPALGMAVNVYDDDGRATQSGKGELVCTRPFPSMPIMFWNDASREKYRAAYFDRFQGVWTHGDFAVWSEHGGLIILGRSDATLKPGGIRIGTAEIYNQVSPMPEIVDIVCVGQNWDDDVRIVMFAKLRDGVVLDGALERRIREIIVAGTSVHHVPSRIVQVSDLPRTRSGKVSELAVTDVINGNPVRNLGALANPECLDQFRGID